MIYKFFQFCDERPGFYLLVLAASSVFMAALEGSDFPLCLL